MGKTLVARDPRQKNVKARQDRKKKEVLEGKRDQWPTHEKMSPEPSIGKLQCVRVALWGPRGGQM